LEVLHLAARQRYPRARFTVWTDDRWDFRQAAVAVYLDDEKVREVTRELGPFDTLTEVFAELLGSLGHQPRLW